MSKNIYFFGSGKADGSQEMRNLLGGKGANLAEMTNLGLPVPPGFTISTEVCHHYYQNDSQYPESLKSDVESFIKKMESVVEEEFGSVENPLLVSVRSGAPVSMPGMMDTILNLGLNDETVKGLAKQSNDERFAYDAYRRFVQMYSEVVLGVSSYCFESLLREARTREKVEHDYELSVDALKGLVAAFKEVTSKRFRPPLSFRS